MEKKLWACRVTKFQYKLSWNWHKTGTITTTPRTTHTTALSSSLKQHYIRLATRSKFSRPVIRHVCNTGTCENSKHVQHSATKYKARLIKLRSWKYGKTPKINPRICHQVCRKWETIAEWNAILIILLYPLLTFYVTITMLLWWSLK